MCQGHLAIGGHHINGVGHQCGAIGGIADGQRGDALQQGAQPCFVQWACVLNHHTGHLGVQREMGEELFKCGQAPRRCPNADHAQPAARVFSLG